LNTENNNCLCNKTKTRNKILKHRQHKTLFKKFLSSLLQF
jgi:hypothetical protein